MTLSSSFQYEEAFGKEDPLIGYRAPRRAKILKSCGIESEEEYIRNRVFTVLEKFCLTKEAKTSFLEFKTAYEKKFRTERRNQSSSFPTISKQKRNNGKSKAEEKIDMDVPMEELDLGKKDSMEEASEEWDWI